jgi:pimeloyl-ACP methyl ester carboxylesterase
MPAIALAGTRLHYDERGGGDGAPIVLLHGLGSSSADWAFQLPGLARYHRVLAVDLRAHGRSSRPRGRLTIEAMANDVAVLLAALGVPPAHVVGLSLGGCVALTLALDHPECVRSLTLVNAFARLTPAGPRGALRMLTRLALLAFAPMRVVAAHIAGGLFPRPDQRALYRAAVASIGSNPRATYLSAIRAVLGFDARRRLAAVRCPTLVVAGDRDTTVPLAAKTRLQQGIADSELLVVADSGHATPCDQAERFNAALLAFVAAH